MRVKFDLGENRHVKLIIHSLKNENFEIDNASYTLTKVGNTEEESSGPCMIYDHEIDSVISPNEKGVYHLKITYKILDETLIDIVEVMVT